MTTTEYRQALDALPFGKRLPGAVYLIDPGEDIRIPSLLRITVGELRKRLEIGTGCGPGTDADRVITRTLKSTHTRP